MARDFRDYALSTCPECDYDLRGLPRTHQCPECGLRFTEDMRMFEGRRSRKAFEIVMIITMGICLSIAITAHATQIGMVESWGSILLLFALLAALVSGLWFERRKRRYVIVTGRSVTYRDHGPASFRVEYG